MSLIKLSCDNCSGKLTHIEKDIYKCKYCDTYYRFENNTTINIENYNAPTSTRSTQIKPKNLGIGIAVICLIGLGSIFAISQSSTSTRSTNGTQLLHADKEKNKSLPVRTRVQSQAMKEFETYFLATEKKSLADIKAFKLSEKGTFDKTWTITYSFSGTPDNPDSYFKEAKSYDLSEMTLAFDKEDIQLLTNIEYLDFGNASNNITVDKELYGDNSSLIYKPLKKLTYLRGTNDDRINNLVEGLYDTNNIRGLYLYLNDEESLTNLITHFKKITSLFIHGVSDELAHSTKLTDLTDLPIKKLILNLPTTATNIDWLSKFSSLESLSVSGGKISDWTFLTALTNLAALKIDDENFNNGSLIEKLPKLTDLTIDSNSIQNWAPIETKKTLTKLDLTLQRKPFNVANLTNLTDLNLHFGPLDADIQTAVAKLPKLRRYTTDCLEPVPIDQIKEIRIDRIQGFTTDQVVPSMKNLEKMTLNGDFRYATFGEYPAIKNLTVDFPEFGMQDLGSLTGQLSHFKTLEEIEFYNIQGLEGTDVALPNLKRFIISKIKHDTNLIEPSFIINHSPNIEQLTLKNTNVSKIDPLINLKKLRSLDIRGNAINSLEPLEKLENLKIILTKGNPLTNSTLDNDTTTLLP